MIAALCYLQYHSARNRLVTRFKRLKQPKYLVGAIAGGLYFYFYFFRYLLAGGRPSGARFTLAPEHALLLESAAALVLCVILLLAWIIPHERAALTFSEAEVAFLFPAPVTRRTLIHFKLLRSQLRILFSVLVLTLVSRRFGGNVWTHALGWWLMLGTLNLHFLGASFTRTLLLDRGISNRTRRLLVLTLAGLVAAGVWWWARRTLPPLTARDTADLSALLNYAEQVLNTGPAWYVLYPFRLLVRPFLAPEMPAFLTALAPAVLLALLHYLWVIFSDVAFEEASVEASQKLATRMAAVRAGNWHAAKQNQKARRAWFPLAPAGPPALALFWKNLIGTGQAASPRLIIVIIVVCTGALAGFGHNPHTRHLPVILGFFILFTLAYSLLLGPQLLRLDFRRDLPLADLLKTFPLRGWQIALGEILAPAVLLTGFQWLLLVIGAGAACWLPGGRTTLWLVVAASLALVLPALNGLLLMVPNAAVLLFPSWIQTGKDSPRGLEATGQRLVFALGQLLVMIVALLPVAVAALAVYFPLKLVLGPVAPIGFAALAATIVLAGEALLGVLLLGKLFERFDVTEEISGS
jgi:hypothetical protein